MAAGSIIQVPCSSHAHFGCLTVGVLWMSKPVGIIEESEFSLACHRSVTIGSLTVQPPV